MREGGISMKVILNLIKIFTLFLIVGLIIYILIKDVPHMNDAKWNPIHTSNQQNVDEDGYVIPAKGKKYILEENQILRNVPSSQARHFFNWIDKYEFMQVNAFSRMGYDDKYLIAQRDTQYLIYRFGSDHVRVYTTEHDLYSDLNQLGHQIEMHPIAAYQ